MKKQIGIKANLETGWKITKENFWFLAAIVLISFIVPGVPRYIADNAAKDIVPLRAMLHVINIILGSIITMGLIKIALKFCDGKKGEFNDIFSCVSLLLKYLVSSFLMTIIVIGGMILLVVPGIIWGVKFSLFPYFIVEKNAGPIEALKASAGVTKGAKGPLFLFYILAGLVNLGGFACLFVGLLATLPITMIATALVYRELLSQAEEAQPSLSTAAGSGQEG